MDIEPVSTLHNLGEKGYHLRLLKQICNVPEFFVVSFDTIYEIENEDVQKQILDYYERHDYGLVSVRSSVATEDGEQSSFGRMFDTVLNVDREGLIEAIKKVVNSVKGRTVIDYCKLKGIYYSKVAMRVIIQKMVDSEISGECFTKPPDSFIETYDGKEPTDWQIEEVSETAMEIGKFLHFSAASIEWAYEEDELYILQAREVIGKSTWKSAFSMV